MENAMNNKYLWDRTGEPDPEIQELEELLGTLRYQPRPLRIPANLSIARRRPFFLPVTIAAAIVMLAILCAFWIHFSRQSATPTREVKRELKAAPAPGVNQPEQKTVVAQDQSNPPQPRPQKPRNLVANNRRSNSRALPPRLTPEEQA